MAKKKDKEPDDWTTLVGAGVALLAGAFIKKATDDLFGKASREQARHTRGGTRRRPKTKKTRYELVTGVNEAQKALRRAVARSDEALARYRQLHRDEEDALARKPLWTSAAFHDLLLYDRGAIKPGEMAVATSKTGAGINDPRTGQRLGVALRLDTYVDRDGIHVVGNTGISFEGTRYWHLFHEDPVAGRMLSVGPRDPRLDDGHYRRMADLLFALGRDTDALPPFDVVGIHPVGRNGKLDTFHPEPPAGARAIAIEASRVKGGR